MQANATISHNRNHFLRIWVLLIYIKRLFSTIKQTRDIYEWMNDMCYGLLNGTE